MPGLRVNVTVQGLLFSPQGSQIIREVGEKAVRQLIEDGESRLAMMLRPRPQGVFLGVSEAQRGKASTGNYRRSVNGRFEGLAGRIDDGNVVYGPWLEGNGSRNATTRFKGYASFRRVAQWLNGRARGVVQNFAEDAVRRLN